MFPIPRIGSSFFGGGNSRPRLIVSSSWPISPMMIAEARKQFGLLWLRRRCRRNGTFGSPVALEGTVKLQWRIRMRLSHYVVGIGALLFAGMLSPVAQAQRVCKEVC